jgi:hypothetical protein
MDVARGASAWRSYLGGILVQTRRVGAMDIRPASIAGVWDVAFAAHSLAMLRLSRLSRHVREGDDPHSGAHGFFRTVAGGGPVWH